MKKLNRKGFTLVELLAVIIILAIVVGITIPAILNTVSGAKVKAFTSAAETTADWVERQYQIYVVDSSNGSLNQSLKTKFDGVANSTTKVFTVDDQPTIEAAGLKTTNVNQFKVYINGSRVCVLLEAKTATGSDYAGVGSVDNTGNAANPTNTNYAKGGACSSASGITGFSF